MSAVIAAASDADVSLLFLLLALWLLPKLWRGLRWFFNKLSS